MRNEFTRAIGLMLFLTLIVSLRNCNNAHKINLQDKQRQAIDSEETEVANGAASGNKTKS